MGIPLAALAIRPPEQQPSAISQYAQAAQLKNELQNAPLQHQALQQQVQIGAQQQADQQATTKALQSWDGKDVHDLPGLLLKNGGSAQAVFGMKNQMLEQQKTQATLDETTLKNNQTRNDLISGHLEAVKGLPSDQRPQAYTSAIQDLEQKGIVKPGTISSQYPGDDKLDLFEKSFMGQKQITDNAIKERETKAKEQEAQARASTAQTTAARLQAEGPGGAMQPVDQKELSDYLTKNPGKGPIDFAKYKASLAPQAAINVQGNIGGAQGDALVNAVANGSMKIGDVLTPRTPLPVRQEFLNKVMATNPQFNSAAYDVEKGVMKDFTSGKAAQNLNSFNTAIEHAKQLNTATDALDNGDLRVLNKIGNTLGFETGSDKQTNFNVVKNAVSGEISKVFKGGQATDAEIAHVMAPFDAANSPAQLKGAINQAITLMNSKRDALKAQYEAGRKAQPAFGGATGSSSAPHPFFDQFGGAARPQ